MSASIQSYNFTLHERGEEKIASSFGIFSKNIQPSDTGFTWTSSQTDHECTEMAKVCTKLMICAVCCNCKCLEARALVFTLWLSQDTDVECCCWFKNLELVHFLTSCSSIGWRVFSILQLLHSIPACSVQFCAAVNLRIMELKPNGGFKLVI